MRVALCALAAVLSCANVGLAQEAQKVNPRWKQIEIPTIDPNMGFTAKFGADQSNVWSTPDPSSIGQSRRSWNDDDRAFGLTISRPLR
ncbi:MAG TPA: hypothetical protein VFA57_04525 [Pseudolabrys sp.]|jgi:hypothetical protein|nr:hypothetical protein [Pseudolabrys sp.]